MLLGVDDVTTFRVLLVSSAVNICTVIQLMATSIFLTILHCKNKGTIAKSALAAKKAYSGVSFR